VSDERDSDATGEETPRPGVTGPLRPTGKRSRQRPGTTALAEREPDEDDEGLTEEFDSLEETAGKKVRKDGAGSRNPFVFVFNYIKQVVAELRKVIWPNRKQMVNYTLVVLAFLVFMVALIGLVDLGLAKLVMMVFGES
jgi:preprotein translocase subunit SecE